MRTLMDKHRWKSVTCGAKVVARGVTSFSIIWKLAQWTVEMKIRGYTTSLDGNQITTNTLKG